MSDTFNSLATISNSKCFLHRLYIMYKINVHSGNACQRAESAIILLCIENTAAYDKDENTCSVYYYMKCSDHQV